MHGSRTMSRYLMQSSRASKQARPVAIHHVTSPTTYLIHKPTRHRFSSSVGGQQRYSSLLSLVKPIAILGGGLLQPRGPAANTAAVHRRSTYAGIRIRRVAAACPCRLNLAHPRLKQDRAYRPSHSSNQLFSGQPACLEPAPAPTSRETGRWRLRRRCGPPAAQPRSRWPRAWMSPRSCPRSRWC